MRLPYNKASAQTYVYGSPAYSAPQCYIVVVQDVRGSFASQGEFYPFRHEMEDGFDTVEWAAALPGATAGSACTASPTSAPPSGSPPPQKPPNLPPSPPAMTSSDYYDGWTYEGGAFALAFEKSWPVSDLAPVTATRLGDQSLLERLAKAKADMRATYGYLPIEGYPPAGAGPAGARRLLLRLGPAPDLGRLLEAVEHPGCATATSRCQR